MTANEWVGIAVGVCAIATSLLVGLRWVIKFNHFYAPKYAIDK